VNCSGCSLESHVWQGVREAVYSPFAKTRIGTLDDYTQIQACSNEPVTPI
jgi:hypothetical protein